MNLIKDVTDQDIENLFDNNNTTGFVDESVTPNKSEESLIPAELDVNKSETHKIERPENYQTQESRQNKIDDKKEAEKLLESSPDSLLKMSGSVGSKLFNEIAKARKQAQLEEFVAKQRKLPQIAPTARYKLYGGDPKCTFHVYQPINVLSDGRYFCSCKFCSQAKTFSILEWKKYELENRQYM